MIQWKYRSLHILMATWLASTVAFAEEAWETLETSGEPVARHEAAFVEFQGEFYLMGGEEIPADRRRGAAGTVLVEGMIYIVGGIVNGHMGGYVNWFDRYDPATGTWTRLKDALHQRDHFQCAYLDAKIYAAGGRTTSKETGQVFDLVVPAVDVFDLETGQWMELPEELPTPRAGNSTTAIGKDIVVAGGESKAQKRAHAEVEAWDTESERWHDYPPLNRGRHGTSLILHQNYIYTCSGSGNMGGSPELKSLERLKIRTR